jgi:hypothetical protein
VEARHQVRGVLLDRTRCRVSWLTARDDRIIPLSAAIYFLCNLDRSNIGNARILNSTNHNDMQTELGMNPTQFNIALMIFLIGYFVWRPSPSSPSVVR